jgi:hypothetical protein
MNPIALAAGRAIHVVELNPYAPRPFVFTEAAICLTEAIRAAGFTAEHVHNRIDPAAFSIVLGATPALPAGVELDARSCAVFNFEQLGGNSAVGTPEYRRGLREWLVLDYHSRNVEFLRAENGPLQQALELPIVPSARLAEPAGDEPKTVDVLFFGTPNPRRDAVLQALRQAGLSVEVVAGAYANELAPAVRRARLVLHIHFYESALFPVVRMVQPVARGIPIVCEDAVFSAGADWSASGIRFAPYAQLVDACRTLLASPVEQRERAQRTQAFARTIDFATPLREAIGMLQARASAPPDGGGQGGPEGERLQTNREIEEILAREAEDIPEAHLEPPEPAIVKREPGQGRLGRWVAWLLVAFSLLTILQAMRR